MFHLVFVLFAYQTNRCAPRGYERGPWPGLDPSPIQRATNCPHTISISGLNRSQTHISVDGNPTLDPKSVGRGLNTSIGLTNLRLPSVLLPSSLTPPPAKNEAEGPYPSCCHRADKRLGPGHMHTCSIDAASSTCPDRVNTPIRPIRATFDRSGTSITLPALHWDGPPRVCVQHRRNDGGTEGRTPL